MKDWNDAYKAGVDIRAVADAAPLYKADNVIPLHRQSRTPTPYPMRRRDRAATN